MGVRCINACCRPFTLTAKRILWPVYPHELITIGEMQRMKRRRIFVHALCLPWAALPLLWLLAWLPPVQEIAFVGLLVVHKLFHHEWYGRVALAVSDVALLTGFIISPLTPKWLACLLGYSILLGCLTAYTVWWIDPGQQGNWPIF